MHRDAGIAEHRLGPRRRHRDRGPVRAFDRIAQIPEMAVDLLLLDLEVGDRGLQPGVPVDEPLVLVDQPLPVKADEGPDDGPRQALVHGEALAAPVRRIAEAPHLPDDRPARALLPFPHLGDERRPAHLAAADIGARARQLALDHHLRRDAGMVRARLPQHRLAAHPLEADQRVLDRVVEGVAHVQAAGDVGRRQHDAERLGRGVGTRREQAGVLPRGIDAGLDLCRAVGLVEHGSEEILDELARSGRSAPFLRRNAAVQQSRQPRPPAGLALPPVRP